MSGWAARMHRSAATISNVVTSCGHPPPYQRCPEKLKFGVSLDEVCKHDIPGPLLVLILKLNKEAPFRRDVFRAPGHEGAMKKLMQFLQCGRLVNLDNFSVYTIASVLKKFLRKIPGGIFGSEAEMKMFLIVDIEDSQVRTEEIQKIIASLPIYTQRLLVLLFGTFRVIASNSDKASTGMSSEALGVSVAPSIFHSCVTGGKTAKMEDILKYKLASRVVKLLIDEFASENLFGRQNYEYYCRVTGRVIRVRGEWICSFEYPHKDKESYEKEHMALQRYLLALSQIDECQSTPALFQSGIHTQISSTSLGMLNERAFLESSTRLSISLEQNGVFQGNTTHSSSHSSYINHSGPNMSLDELKQVNKYAESTRSLSYLPQVHQRQTERMKTRSQWFLGPTVDCTSCGGSLDIPLNDDELSSILATTLLRRSSSGTIVGITGLSLSAESIQKRPSIKRSNSKDHRFKPTARRNVSILSRNNSYKSHEGEYKRARSRSPSGSFKIKADDLTRSCSFNKELCNCPPSTSGTGNNGNQNAESPLQSLIQNVPKQGINSEKLTVTVTYLPVI